MILIISGTNRTRNKTLSVCNIYKQEIEKKGAVAEVISLDQLPNSFIKSDMYGSRSDTFKPIQEKITKCEKLIFIAPEYNGSIPGILKTFIDGCDFPQSFKGKKAALVGISSGRHGNLRGISHLTGILNYMGVTIMPDKMYIQNINGELSETGEILIASTEKYIQRQIDSFLEF
jgi:chromate reductase